MADKSNLKIIGGDGDQRAVALRDMATGTTTRPCMRCKSWERDPERLVRHFLAHGLLVKPDGTIYSPIHKDFKDRVGMEINVRDFGYCRFHMQPSENLHTCKQWVPVDKLAANAARGQ